MSQPNVILMFAYKQETLHCTINKKYMTFCILMGNRNPYCVKTCVINQ